MLPENLEKEIVMRIKRIKCQQKQCRSSNTESQEIVVFNLSQQESQNQKITKTGVKKGIMCTSCFIDQQLLSKLGNAEHHAMSVQKFMKVLTKEYTTYAQIKRKESWPPNMIEQENNKIKKKIIGLEKQIEKGIMEIMKYLDDASKETFQKAKELNNDKALDKLYEVINQEDEQEQERMNVTNEIKELTGKMEMQHGQFRFAGEEAIKRQNERLLNEYKDKINKGRECILKLTEVMKKCIKHLIE